MSIERVMRAGRMVAVDTRLEPMFGGAPEPVLNTDPPVVLNGTGLYQGLSDGSIFVRPLSQFNNSGASDDAGTINAMLELSPVVRLGPWTYNIASAVTADSAGQQLIGAGLGQTVFKFTGTGDCLRLYNPTYNSPDLMGGVTGITIDGTGAGAGSAGIHAGDGIGFVFDCGVENFTGSGSIGVHFDNTIFWTEQIKGRIWSSNNTRHVVFDVSSSTTATDSFDYADLTVIVEDKGGQDGVVFQNGAAMVHGRLLVKGNFATSATALSNAVLRIEGTVPTGNPGAGSYAGLTGCHLDVQAECDGTGTYTPQTIVYGTVNAGNFIKGCAGVVDFASGTAAFTASNWTAAAGPGQFQFDGPLRGDSNLGVPAGYVASSNTGVQLFGEGYGGGNNGILHGQEGDFFSFTLTASVTITLVSAGSCFPHPQRKTIVIKQAAAGGFTVTWPHAAAPSISAPSVLWPGGSAPTMTSAAGATDVYDLETIDGATWYGSAKQNVS